MMDYIYPAVFENNNGGSCTIAYPDLPGCISGGKSLTNAMVMAQRALTQWIEFLTDNNEIPSKVSDLKSVAAGERKFVNLIRADVKDRRAVSIPKWMDDKVSEAGLSLSWVLQGALSQRLQ